MDFDWDDGNTAKCAKHGMTSAEIEGFFRLRPRVLPDPAHSAVELRFLAVGPTGTGRMALVAFCWRDGRIRPISARYMHSREVRRYDQTAAKDRPRDDDG